MRWRHSSVIPALAQDGLIKIYSKEERKKKRKKKRSKRKCKQLEIKKQLTD
jgi:hypothetical protein